MGWCAAVPVAHAPPPTVTGLQQAKPWRAAPAICIDIAIAKEEALRQLGFAANDLYLVTGRMFSGRLEAGLIVRTGEQFWLLDARSDQLTDANHMSSFSPIVTYGVGMTWAHSVPVGKPRILTKPAVIARAAPRPGHSPQSSSSLVAK